MKKSELETLLKMSESMIAKLVCQNTELVSAIEYAMKLNLRDHKLEARFAKVIAKARGEL